MAVKTARHKHPLYQTWKMMRREAAKCGAEVCSRWGIFDCFIEDVGPRPEGCRLYRINKRAGFSPSNCTWRHQVTPEAHKSGIYTIWRGIILRCESPGVRTYAFYGARGIKMCRRWRQSFAAFQADVGPRPSPKHSLDRIDNDGHYEPGNVRWATYSEQAINRRSSKRPIAWRGRTMRVHEWASELGIPICVLYRRLRDWGADRALATPYQARQRRAA